MTRTPRRRLASAGGLLAAAALLASCAIPLPEVDPDPAPTVTQPVLDEPRMERVLAEVEATIAAADEAGDASLLAPRVADPALAVRTAEYALQAATAESETPSTPQPLTAVSDVDIVAATDTWPRTVMVVTEIPDGGNVPLLLALQQADPRSNYLLHDWVRLLPAVTMPETAVPEIGSPPVAVDAEGLVLAPAAALAAYADLLSKGDESEFAATFAEDQYRTLVAQEIESLTAGIEEAGTVEHSTSVREDPVLTLGTEDGGAIVLGALTTSQVFTKTIEGSELVVGGQIAALAGGDGEIADVDDTLTATYVQMIALYVPPAAEGATITVLGAERVLSGATKS